MQIYTAIQYISSLLWAGGTHDKEGLGTLLYSVSLFLMATYWSSLVDSLLCLISWPCETSYICVPILLLNFRVLSLLSRFLKNSVLKKKHIRSPRSFVTAEQGIWILEEASV